MGNVRKQEMFETVIAFVKYYLPYLVCYNVSDQKFCRNLCLHVYNAVYNKLFFCFFVFCRSTFVGSALSLRGGVVQWVARLTRNVKVVGSSPIKGPRCFLEQETLPLLLSTGWFQERA